MNVIVACFRWKVWCPIMLYTIIILLVLVDYGSNKACTYPFWSRLKETIMDSLRSWRICCRQNMWCVIIYLSMWARKQFSPFPLKPAPKKWAPWSHKNCMVCLFCVLLQVALESIIHWHVFQKKVMPLELGILFFKKHSVFSPVLPCRYPAGIMRFKRKPKVVFTRSKGLGGRFVGNWVQAQLQPPPCGALIPIKPTPLALPYTKVFAS
jgi:hypothetical protein